MAKAKDRYHHGDLRAALIGAAEEVLAETGIEAFSLRQVAKRVGVSHSAPAHHFGDAQGLLNALAAEGFRRFLAAMQARQAEAEDDPRAQVIASGLGYLDFAERAPALFRLMFASGRSKVATPELEAAGLAAFHNLTDGIARLRGVSPFEDPAAMMDVTACWSIIHGFSELYISGRLVAERQQSRAERDDYLRRLLLKALT
jgi:AcrR family transcriptional regulator